eukprot:CAMPEP_0119101900 /NCGR_PEP_ID=MMETSP1180-20130426/810_1 /TAXON_ID=3052 ORGANISM="Chlamydomonas cf sp, Strain CCMP681" /NCGR_SAMPLE_ID=MMETSP1180 /ASSEMBLY_ACC=CAM_ASM_000741 /LENGTH=201 /DNA_ID=CAMNT_0007086081 /DNA_START=199 /DNA_END=803 /DNA_ORIENTATION=+
MKLGEPWQAPPTQLDGWVDDLRALQRAHAAPVTTDTQDLGVLVCGAKVATPLGGCGAQSHSELVQCQCQDCTQPSVARHPLRGVFDLMCLGHAAGAGSGTPAEPQGSGACGPRPGQACDVAAAAPGLHKPAPAPWVDADRIGKDAQALEDEAAVDRALIEFKEVSRRLVQENKFLKLELLRVCIERDCAKEALAEVRNQKQ